ncbi:hypothetical protein Tco_0695989 [Tanacetum coccineum]
MVRSEGRGVKQKKGENVAQTTMDSGNVIMSSNVALPSTCNDVCDSGNVNKDKNAEHATLVETARLETLRKELETMRMKEGEAVDDFVAKLNGIASKVRSLGYELEEVDLVKRLLNSMPKPFFKIVASIEQCFDLDSMFFDEAVGRLKAFEERLKGLGEKEEEQGQVLMAEHKYGESSGQGRGRGRSYGRGERGRRRGLENVAQTTLDSMVNVIMSSNVALPSTCNDVCDSGNVNKDKNAEHATLVDSKYEMDAMIENGLCLIRNMPFVLKKWTPNENIMKEDVCNSPFWVKLLSRALKMLKDTLMVVVPKFLGKGYSVSIIRDEYEWTPPRCSSCKVFGQVMDECPKKINGASSNGTKKQAGLTRQEASTFTLFDSINIVEHDDELGTNEGKSKLAKKGSNSNVVSSAYGASSKAFGSPNTTSLAARFKDLERQMLVGKFVLMDDDDDDGKPIKPKVDNPVNADSESEVYEMFNETASFMASTSSKQKL